MEIANAICYVLRSPEFGLRATRYLAHQIQVGVRARTSRTVGSDTTDPGERRTYLLSSTNDHWPAIQTLTCIDKQFICMIN